MLLICLHSGLGNQIGNYVFAQLLIERGFSVKFLVTKDENLDRTYVLDKFNTDIEQASIKDIKNFMAFTPPSLCFKNFFYNVLFRNKAYFNSLYKVLARIRAEYGLFPKKTPLFLAKILSFEDVLKYGLKQGAVCDCYCPIPEFYEENFKNKMKKHLTLKESWDTENKRILEKIKTSKNPVGVHIRRGDYLNLKIPVVKSEFILEKMKYLSQNLDGTCFFIFSDDINWAKDNIKGFKNVEFADKNDESKGYLDFSLMNECKHRIYSASSFSVWLKYLNPHTDSLEFMPETADLTVEKLAVEA